MSKTPTNKYLASVLVETTATPPSLVPAEECAWTGKSFVQIGRFEPSSKMCPCGKINNALTLADRIWQCECGPEHDRDILAACNIKKFALQKQNLVGLVEPELTLG